MHDDGALPASCDLGVQQLANFNVLCESGDVDQLERFLSLPGSDPNSRMAFGRTMLHRWVGSPAILQVEFISLDWFYPHRLQRLLRVPGLDLEARDDNGETPLLLALRSSTQSARLLFEAGASPLPIHEKTKRSAIHCCSDPDLMADVPALVLRNLLGKREREDHGVGKLPSPLPTVHLLWRPSERC